MTIITRIMIPNNEHNYNDDNDRQMTLNHNDDAEANQSNLTKQWCRYGLCFGLVETTRMRWTNRTSDERTENGLKANNTVSLCLLIARRRKGKESPSFQRKVSPSRCNIFCSYVNLSDKAWKKDIEYPLVHKGGHKREDEETKHSRLRQKAAGGLNRP